MSKYRQWLCTTIESEETDWANPNIEALEQVLVCTVTNISNAGDKYGTLQLKFASPLTESAIRKRMQHGISTLQPLDGRTSDKPKKRKRSTMVDASTQTELATHVSIIEKIKAMKARVEQLEAENAKLKDNNDINYIASFLD